MTELHVPVVVVTGASSGIGRATALAFAKRGARVGLIARNRDGLDAAAHEVSELGGRPLSTQVDVSDAGAVEDAAERIEQELGPIDIWVNSAMVTVFAPALEVTSEEYSRVTSVTYLGSVHGTVAALRRMRSRDRGTIIQVGSALAYRSIPLQSAYCGAKAALRAWTDSLRTELLHDGSNIRLVMLDLPAVNTPQASRQRNKMDKQAQPVPPMFSPEDIGEVVVWAAEQKPREVLIGWPAVKAVWGHRLFPGLADKIAAKSWSQQLIDQPNQQAGDILFETLPGDPGMHGPYREKEISPDLAILVRTRGLAGLQWWSKRLFDSFVRRS